MEIDWNDTTIQGAVIGVVGMIVAAILGWRLGLISWACNFVIWLFTPAPLAVSFDDDEDCVHDPDAAKKWALEDAPKMRFLRVRVRNPRSEQIDDVRADLFSIEKQREGDGEFVPTNYSGQRLLTWFFRPDDDAVTIPGKGEFFVDVVQFQSNRTDFQPCLRPKRPDGSYWRSASDERLFSETGVFRLTVHVSTPFRTWKQTIVFPWNGTFPPEPIFDDNGNDSETAREE